MEHPRRHIVILLAYFIVSIVLYLLLISVATPIGVPFFPFLSVWEIAFVPYFAACIWVLATKPLSGRGLWVELGIILASAFIFRVMLLNVQPNLSGDVWRYVWDGRVIAHGYSPYLYAPASKELQPIRDIVFHRANWRLTPTKYPPGAELFYVLGYLITPRDILGIKSLFVVSDMVTSVALIALLMRKQLDPRRAILYAWSPLPIVEFAVQGHVDVITITFTVLAVLCASSPRGFMRVLAGICIGLATLTKLYPIILLLLLVRRRDWGLLVACVATIIIGYVPFIILSQGHISMLFSFLGQQDVTISVIQDELNKHARLLGLDATSTRLVGRLIVLFLLGTIVPITLFLRFRKRIDIEAALLILVGTILLVYSHIFPWYAPALLPWIAVLAMPVWMKGHLSGRGLAVLMPWYFTWTIPLSYIMALKAYNTDTNWNIDYYITFFVVLVGLMIAAVVEVVSPLRHAKIGKEGAQEARSG